jgi:superfamily II DNA or RNA helicase
MIHFVEVPNKRGIGKTYQEIYNNYVVENEERNQKIVDAARQLVQAGRRVLILIVRKNHGKILQEMLETDLTVASLDGSNKTEDRLEAIRAMRAGEVNVLIASKIFDQGVDIPELDALILAGSGKSTGRALQRIGRVIRTGPKSKKDAVVVDFYDNCKYLRDHSRSRYKIYSTEPEFRIKLPKGRRKL